MKFIPEKYIIHAAYSKLVLLIIIPLVLLLLPADYFNEGREICLSKVLLNQTCAGCGLTRACMNIIHFNFKEAWEFNKLSYVVFPILSLFWIKEFISGYRKIKSN